MNEAYILPIVGVIGEDFKFTDILMHLNAAKNYSSIKLCIDSVGGLIEAGLKIKDALINSGKNLFSTNIGNVASIAVSIFLSAPKQNRTFDPAKGIFLIHNPWVGIEGDAKFLKMAAKELTNYENELLNQYVNSTGSDTELLRAFMNENQPLNEKQIEQLGFAQIIKTAELKAVAKYNINLNTNKMTDNKDEKMNLLDKLLDKFEKMFAPKNLVLQDVNGIEIDFGAAITEPSQIIIGTQATINSDPANGEFTMPDGSKIKFEGGAVIEVSNEQQPPVMTNDAAIIAENEKLKVENSTNTNVIKALNKENNDLKAKLSEISTEYLKFKNQFSKSNISDIKAPETIVNIVSKNRKPYKTK